MKFNTCPLPTIRHLVFIGLMLQFGFCSSAALLFDQPSTDLPVWMEDQVIYEVNVRQYSEQGNFRAVTNDLDRIASLGIRTIWLMPIHPIGEINRKGPLGSYYAVRDYLAVNPEFGTEEDFRELVNAAHEREMKVILDWVGNHTAWDNALTREHPEFFLKDSSGRLMPPVGTDWTDVVQLDFNAEGLLEYQTRAMLYWVEHFDIDGFRCDFASGVPTAFWEKLNASLLEAEPGLFLLAEAQVADHQLKAFHASYGWEMMHTFNDIAKGEKNANDIDATLAATRLRFPEASTQLYMTSNHDENSWNGTAFERLGAGVQAFAVLTFALDGIPLIYNGQEIGLSRRLKFFENDPIEWKPSAMTEFYRVLAELKAGDSAWKVGAPSLRIPSTEDTKVYVLLRGADEESQILTIVNLTPEDLRVEIGSKQLEGRWRDAFTGEVINTGSQLDLELQTWEYRVWVKQ